MVVVGAGFGGLTVARDLADAPVDVIVVDARNHHTFQPLLYQVATAGLDGDDVCYAVRGVFAGQRNARVVLGRVVGGDLAAQVLTFEDGTELGYDHLVLACGAITATFGVEGVEEHAFGLKSLTDAVEIRDHVLLRFEHADARPDDASPGALTVVIAGGGPTGVEMAGGLAELFDDALRRDFPRLDVSQARVVLVEAGERLLPTFDPSLSARAERALQSKGVELHLGVGVASITPCEVRMTDGAVVPSETVVWAAGVRAHPLAAALGLETMSNGRAVVTDQLTVPGHPEIHVIGDVAAATDSTGALLPQVAPVAMQQARFVAARLVSADDAAGAPFRYRDKGSMATIGRNQAVAQLPGGIRLTGVVGWLAWLVLHLVMLVGFRNRANVVVNWAWNYVTYDRASRIIAGPKARDGAPPPPVRSRCD